MYKVFYLSFITAILFISCNNDDDSSQEEQVAEESFYALKIGNNWTYEYFRRVAQTDEFETLGAFEEVEITETTIIDGETYFVFKSTITGNDIAFLQLLENSITTKNIRDSLGFLIQVNHPILFSSENSNDYLISDNEWGDIYGVLKENLQEISVPAGTFSCLENEIYAILANTGEMSPGRSRIYFSDGIGEIFQEISGVSNPDHRWEKRLIDFEILE